MIKPLRILTLFIFIAFLLTSCNCPEKESIKGPYAGSPVPGETPELFAPGFITTGLYERDVAIDPVDGNELYFSVFLGDWATIMVSRNTDDGWTTPEVATFARDTLVNFCEPAFTPDGRYLLFLCTLPLDGSDPRPGWADQNIWMVSRGSDGQWSDRLPLAAEINNAAQFFPSVARDGTFYYTRTDTATQVSSIFKAKWPLQSGLAPEALPAAVNGPGSIFNACISPDGSCLVACAVGRDSLSPPRRAVYYAFFKEGEGWSDGKKLTEVLRVGDGNAISPSFSPDGKYLFFATNKKRNELSFSRGGMNLDYFRERRDMPGNGNSDIYWVDSRVIFDLKN